MNLSLAKAFNDPEFSDLVIKCQETTYYCHRVILCNRLPYFDAACRLNMKEKSSRIIEFKEEEPATVEVMLRFLYMGKLGNQTGSMTPDEVTAHVLLGAKIYALGEKLTLPALKEAVLSKMLHPCVKQVEMRSFPALVRIAYSSTPESDRKLRDLVLDNAVKRKDEWEPAFRNSLLDHPDFAVDLVMLHLKSYEDLHINIRCEDCHTPIKAAEFNAYCSGCGERYVLWDE